MGYKEYNNESGNSFDSDEMNAAKQSLELLDVEIVRARSTLADCVKSRDALPMGSDERIFCDFEVEASQVVLDKLNTEYVKYLDYIKELGGEVDGR
jgi:hypothetical protein